MSSDSSKVTAFGPSLCAFVCGAVVVLWMWAIAVLELVFFRTWFSRRWNDWSGFISGFDDFEVLVGFGVVYLPTMLVTTPLVARVLQAIRAAMLSTSTTPDLELSSLSPGLRGLVADARALVAALETRDEATLVEVWTWQRRFERLGENDRRELEHLGLGDPGIAELLAWIMETPQAMERGMREIIHTLEQFEQRLLAPSSVFRGPFR